MRSSPLPRANAPIKSPQLLVCERGEAAGLAAPAPCELAQQHTHPATRAPVGRRISFSESPPTALHLFCPSLMEMDEQNEATLSKTVGLEQAVHCVGRRAGAPPPVTAGIGQAGVQQCVQCRPQLPDLAQGRVGKGWGRRRQRARPSHRARTPLYPLQIQPTRTAMRAGALNLAQPSMTSSPAAWRTSRRPPNRSTA